MSMKLLTFQKTKDALQNEQALKVIRSQEVEELAKKTNAKLARAEADFNTTLATNRSKWAVEEQEHQERIVSMSQEIEALEIRKGQALIPISMYKKEADKLMEDAKEILEKAKLKEEQADFILEKLENNLTEVADREQLVIVEEQKQKIAREGIQLQQLQIKDSISSFNEEKIKFYTAQKVQEDSLLERKKEVSLAEISFQAKVDKYRRDMDAMKAWETQLKDERGTLDRAFKRL